MGATSNGSHTNGRFASTQIVPWVAVVISIAAGFWAVANPRDDIKSERIERLEGIHQAKTDIEALLHRIDEEILRVKGFASDKLLSKDEHREFVRRADKSLDTLKGEIDRIRGDQVTRSEHQQHWAETAARIDGVRDLNVQLRKETFDAIATLQKDVGGQFTVGDQIKSLTAQIADLNRRLDMVRPRQAVTQP